MTRIYMIRHGQSEGNLVNSFLGHTDLDLTEKGHRQAENAAHFLENVEADVIYSSDLLRAYNTALHTAEKKGLDVIKNEKLREICAGAWEGKPFELLKEQFADTYSVWLENIGNAVCDEGESVAQLHHRISKEMLRIAKENEGGTVLVFTHATPIRVFKAFCDGKTLGEIKDIPWATNASVSYFEYEDGHFCCVQYSNDFFQGEEKSGIPSNV